MWAFSDLSLVLSHCMAICLENIENLEMLWNLAAFRKCPILLAPHLLFEEFFCNEADLWKGGVWDHMTDLWQTDRQTDGWSNVPVLLSKNLRCLSSCAVMVSGRVGCETTRLICSRPLNSTHNYNRSVICKSKWNDKSVQDQQGSESTYSDPKTKPKYVKKYTKYKQWEVTIRNQQTISTVKIVRGRITAHPCVPRRVSGRVRSDNW